MPPIPALKRTDLGMLRRNFLFTPLLLSAQDAIKVDVNLVNVPFTARDARGQWVQTLTANDLEVTEDGAPQKIAFFSRASDSPLSIAIIADISGSQQKFLKDHRRDLHHFLKTVLTPRDQAMLVCFGNSVRLASPFHHQADYLDDALEDYQKAKNVSQLPRLGPQELRHGGTAFYDAIFHTAKEMANQEGRRAIILLSDGEENSSAHNLMDAIEAAQEYSATIFALRYTELRKDKVVTARNKYGRSVMKRLAQETGGLDFDAAEDKHLKEAFTQISAMLRATYDLAYTSNQPSDDASFRKIRIRSKIPQLSFRHKTGYFPRQS
ncbi:VWA domain-containing protein [Bryobacter aggregatus]|uniref:VWA domain-containing protein n=1 Tax=Bryobacter aggregatus TaxID=360054 RepID=UPI00068EC1D8|nr:VWA domain-containing protein [Bryobacter aggregatus]